MSEKNLWGGRFSGKADPQFAEFNNSFRFDRRLFEVDVSASIAYCAALLKAGEDTIFIAVRDAKAQRAVIKQVWQLLGNTDEHN